MATTTDQHNSNPSIHSPLPDVNFRNAIDTEADLTSNAIDHGECHRSTDAKNHRHSLPTNAQLSSLWQDSTLKAPSDDQSAGSSAAHRATALRQLTGTPLRGRVRHRSVASTGSRTSLSSQPVVVRTYSGSRSRQSSRAPSQTRLPEDAMGKDVKFLPADSFAFDGILRAIEPDVKDTIDAIAQIYARTNLSLADEYGAHMPPQGEITGNNHSRNRQSGPPQRSGGNESTLSVVPEASSSSEKLSDKGRGSKKSSRSNSGPEQRRKSAYGALMDVMAGSPPKDTTSTQQGKKAMRRDMSSEVMAHHSASLSHMRSSQSSFAIDPKSGTWSGASSIHSRTSSLGLTIGRSLTDYQAASAQVTLDLSTTTATEGPSLRPSNQYEVHGKTPNSATSGIWLPWLRTRKGESSQGAEYVLKNLLDKTQSDVAQDPGGLG